MVYMKCPSDYSILHWNVAYTFAWLYVPVSNFIQGFLSLPVMYCSDPGHVEHSTRTLSDPKLLVGTTIQYSCNPGFVLQGGATITCYGREPGTPVWTSRLPHCACEYRDGLQNKKRKKEWFICPLSLWFSTMLFIFFVDDGGEVWGWRKTKTSGDTDLVERSLFRKRSQGSIRHPGLPKRGLVVRWWKTPKWLFQTYIFIQMWLVRPYLSRGLMLQYCQSHNRNKHITKHG